jgi:hypothetical protein
MKVFLYPVFLILLIQNVSAQSGSRFDLTFNLGPSLSQSGKISGLGDPSLSTGFGFNYYFSPNHGMGFGYNSESSFKGSSKFPGLRDASISTFDLHYTYRYIKDKLHIVFEPGLGTQTLYDLDSDYYWGYLYRDDLSTAFILNYKLFVRYVISNLGDDESSDNFFIGAGIIQNFSFNDDYRGKDISGNRLAALFQIGLDF